MPEGQAGDDLSVLTPAQTQRLDYASAQVSNVLGANELNAESAVFVQKLQDLRNKGVLTDAEYNEQRDRALGPPIADTFDPFAQYRRPGNPPWTPQITDTDCSVAAAVNGLQRFDPNLRYEDVEPIINKYRAGTGSNLGGFPPDQRGPFLDELTYNRGLPPSQPVAAAIGTYANPADSAAALAQFMGNHPDTAVLGSIKGHAITITGVNPDGTVHVIEPTFGHADLPPDKILWQYCHIVRGNAGGP